MNKFQERLKELLEDYNLSRLALANKLSISSTTINGYFNKNYYPTIEIALNIAKFFNCSLDYLFGLTDSLSPLSLKTSNFVNRFNFLIKLKNNSIAKTMKELGMSEYNYYRWKKGQLPKTNKLLDIVKYFNTSLDFILGYGK